MGGICVQMKNCFICLLLNGKSHVCIQYPDENNLSFTQRMEQCLNVLNLVVLITRDAAM